MSWWVGKTANEFAAAAPAEQKRMAESGSRPIVRGENQSYAHLWGSEYERDHPNAPIMWSQVWRKFLAVRKGD